MKVYGPLEVAQVEWFTAGTRPAAASYPYRIIWLSDSTALQVSDGSSWNTINSPGGNLYTAVLGSAAQVTAGLATYSSIVTALAGIATNSNIYLFNKTFTENVTQTTRIQWNGSGYGTYLSGTLTLNSGSDHSMISGIRISGNVVLNSDGNILNIFLDSGSTVTDNGNGNVIQYISG